jgi:hypothetical protein
MPGIGIKNRGQALLAAFKTKGGSLIKKIKYGSVSVDPASITNATSLETPVTITGVAVGDVVMFFVPASLETGLVLSGSRVSAANTVQLRLSCIAAAPVDGANRTWEFLWFDLT